MRDKSVWAVWDRALWRRDEDLYGEGDRALAAVLSAHPMIMGDGLQGGVEKLTDPEVDAASDGYRYFGLRKIPELIQRAKPYRHRCDEDIDALLEGFNRDYQQWIPSDDALVDIVERRLREHPGEFAPT